MRVEDYKRTVTHLKYPGNSKRKRTGGWSRILSNVITDNKYELTIESVQKKRNFKEASDRFLVGVVVPYLVPFAGGGVFLVYYL